MTTTRGLAAALLIATAGLTACGSGTHTEAARPAPVMVQTPAVDTAPVDDDPVDAEGSVTTADGRFVTYPNKFTARIAKAEQVPNTWGSSDPGTILIRVTVNLENDGAKPVPLNDAPPAMTLTYGANRQLAHRDAGYLDVPLAHRLQNDLPQRVAPGYTVPFTCAFAIPAGEAGTLALTISPKPGYYTDYTFTDVQAMLHTVG